MNKKTHRSRPAPLHLIQGFALLPLALALIGCAATGPQYPAGDPRHQMTHAERWKAAGWLQVYSAAGWDRKREGGPVSYIHSEYKVFTPEGHIVMNVENGGPMEGPSVVHMDPGRYVVKAQAYRHGTVEVPVTIETGRISVLHLDQENGADIPRS